MAGVKIRDVAKSAGVSIATVSKALSNGAYAHEIPLETVERIRRIATQLGYVPNSAARHLRTRSTQQIGLVLGMEHYPEAAALTLDGIFLLGLINAIAQNQFSGIVIYPREDVQALPDPQRYLDGNIAGLIIRYSTPHYEEHLLQSLASSNLFLVAAWSQAVPEGVGFVDMDHYNGAYQAVEHLLRLGHRNIAYIEDTPIFDHPHFQARYQGYQQALLDAHILPQAAWHICGILEELILPLLQGEEPITAAFAPNDLLASQIAALVQSAGKRIPEDFSLVGFDDLIGAEHVGGGLTTVRQPIREMANQAIHNLKAMIDGAPIEQCRTVLPAQLVIRSSTAAVHTAQS